MSRESTLVAALQEIRALHPAALERIRKGNYVFDKSPFQKPITESDRWQELAFWLYTDLCQANRICRQELAFWLYTDLCQANRICRQALEEEGGRGMTIRISISCEPDEIDDVRTLLIGFIADGIKSSGELLDARGGLTDIAKRDILIRYDEGDPIRDIADDLGVDGRLISGLVLGLRKSPNCPHNWARKCVLKERP